MGDVHFTFASFTYANKAKKALARANVHSSLIKLSADVSNSGCTHGLSLAREDFYTAVTILREQGINYRVFGR